MRPSTVFSIFSAIFAADTTIVAAVPVLAGTGVSEVNPITVKCHNTQEYADYLNCFNSQSAGFCTDHTSSSSGHAYEVCLQQFQKHCAKLAGCDTSH
ncbi:hypothetical protein F5Y17DRAFT_455160 [Xylariaceae sp. FL0594]|nr:hypothetical protein F5Y17DRAFT_455160 [Xylariaceae sp. FL0594]